MGDGKHILWIQQQELHCGSGRRHFKFENAGPWPMIAESPAAFSASTVDILARRNNSKLRKGSGANRQTSSPEFLARSPTIRLGL